MGRSENSLENMKVTKMIEYCKRGCEYYDGFGCESSPLKGCVWRFENCQTREEALELLKKRVANAPHGEVVETIKELLEVCVKKGW